MATDVEWKSFLEKGTVPDQQTTRDAIVKEADSVNFSDDNPTVRDWSQFSRLVRKFYPGEHNIAQHTHTLVGKWAERGMFSPRASPGQQAWLRQMIFSSNSVPIDNVKAKRFVDAMTSDTTKELDMEMRLFIQRVLVITSENVSVVNEDTNTGEGLRLYMEADLSRKKALMKKIATYKRLQVREDLLPMDQEDPKMTEKEKSVLIDWKKQKKLEQSIRNDPYLRGTLGGDVEYIRDLFVRRVKHSGPTPATDAEFEESKTNRKKRRVDEFSTGTTPGEIARDLASGLPVYAQFPFEVGAQKVVRFGRNVLTRL